MQVTLKGYNRKNNFVEVTCSVIKMKNDNLHNTIITWTDGRCAALHGTKVSRMNGTKFTLLMKDIETITFK